MIKFLKDLIEFPIAMYYMLFRSSMSIILSIMILSGISIFIYLVITG